MKIVNTIRRIYDDNKPLYKQLEKEVKETLKPTVETKNWFFLSRVKELESFALKIETGRVPDPGKMEDFLACTIVVPAMAEITQAEQFIVQNYSLQKRRPRTNGYTPTPSSNFRFDDLRLYVTRQPPASGKHPELNDILFEVQIKTILQHAWGLATHDLIYKSNTISWPRERIAFQVKAMLEHAEVAIEGANQLAEMSAVAKQDSRTSNISSLMEHIRGIWPQEGLPEDAKRLAENISKILRGCGLDIDQFPEIIEAERQRVSFVPVDLSPYSFTVQALAQSQSINFQHKFNQESSQIRIVIHRGMELPTWMLESHPRILDLG